MVTERDDEREFAEGKRPVLGDYTPEQLDAKWGFAPGMPLDRSTIPRTYYQVLGGRVYVLTRWKDGSTARGEITLEELARMRGVVKPREGWYDILGEYLGEELELK